jgi:hypothetical protein
MSTSEESTAMARVLGVARILGYFVYLGAFFLPAIREPGQTETYKGSFCAWVTLINTFNPEFLKSRNILAICSGWINPLMILYVGFLFSGRLRKARRLIASVVLVFMLCTWVFFYVAPMVPLIGHFLWIAGILMILAGEIVAQPRQNVS